jgi:3-dehydroquinate synthase
VETFLLQAGRKILHGEAVAAGLVCEAYLAKEKGMLDEMHFQEIRDYILKVFGKVNIASGEDEAIAMLAMQDKKNKDNRILCVLLKGIGDAEWDCEIRPDDVKRALAFYRTA